jgi:hypothetical protein
MAGAERANEEDVPAIRQSAGRDMAVRLPGRHGPYRGAVPFLDLCCKFTL